MKLSNNAPTLTELLEECLAEIEAMYYNQLSLGQHIFWYFSHQAHLGDSFVSFLPFILYLGSNLEEREREREREEDYNVKNREKMTMEINVGRPCWIKICFVSFLDIKFQDTAADSKFHIFVWFYENEKVW